ncbi:MAG: hypothetical protein DI606_19310 [Sphingobium sp.]|nr:MAG: hypothetical protein DI606_19310 [Sphingobium sp.]
MDVEGLGDAIDRKIIKIINIEVLTDAVKRSEQVLSKGALKFLTVGLGFADNPKFRIRPNLITEGAGEFEASVA